MLLSRRTKFSVWADALFGVGHFFGLTIYRWQGRNDWSNQSLSILKLSFTALAANKFSPVKSPLRSLAVWSFSRRSYKFRRFSKSWVRE
ncbi:hypothetical protein Cflav_PD6054 [Pedosphaera parvula Ellin514]|uniref:Uncharacterized protein n=1 Tax=Pedosphaera parvula (strain Ellin514) TaxID=320771 RepID=B9XA78_PEDPL|nr:hypothetical protein Cflav_PD6054 [Pedosphaera parvula Ellin514]